MHKVFLVRFLELIKSEGYEDITTFVNKWVINGGNFRNLHEWLLLKGENIKYVTVWAYLRKFLTIPYSANDSYWYKWNSIAKTKGFNNFAELFNEYNKKFTSKEMADELGINIRTIFDIRLKIDPPSNRKRKKHQKHRDENGFTRTDAKKMWVEILSKKGFKSTIDMARYYNKKDATVNEISKELEISVRKVRERIFKAKLSVHERTNKVLV